MVKSKVLHNCRYKLRYMYLAPHIILLNVVNRCLFKYCGELYLDSLLILYI